MGLLDLWYPAMFGVCAFWSAAISQSIRAAATPLAVQANGSRR